MPQFDIFFFFNNIVFFMISFTVLYIGMTWVFLPKLLKILKIRKQKIEFLNKMNWLYNSRLKQWYLINVHAFSNVSSFVQSFLKKNTTYILKKSIVK